MKRVNIVRSALALLCSVVIFSATTMQASGEGKKEAASNDFKLTVVDVVDEKGAIVKQLRIAAKPDCLAQLTSDKKRGGGVSATAGGADDAADRGEMTVSIFADHVEWETGNVNACKFLVSIHGNGSKAMMSDTGPMPTGMELSDLVAVTVVSGSYQYGEAIPVLRFKDRTFSLTVTAPPFDS